MRHTDEFKFFISTPSALRGVFKCLAEMLPVAMPASFTSFVRRTMKCLLRLYGVPKTVYTYLVTELFLAGGLLEVGLVYVIGFMYVFVCILKKHYAKVVFTNRSGYSSTYVSFNGYLSGLVTSRLNNIINVMYSRSLILIRLEAETGLNKMFAIECFRNLIFIVNYI